MASPAARLLGFLILLAVMFAGAYAAGARLGPVTPARQRPGQGATMQMSAGSAPARPAPAGPAR
jgi:hypothetical protein